MVTTTRVEIVGNYTFHSPFQADIKEEVRVERLPASLLSTTVVSVSTLPSNWNSFCDAADAVLMPLTASKNLYVTFGKVCTGTFYTSFFLCIIEYFVLDREWFEKVILVLNTWVFLPFLFMAVSGMGMAVVEIIFIFKLENVMEELSHVCTQYSSAGTGVIRYQSLLEMERCGKRRRVKDYFILVHDDREGGDNHDVERHQQKQQPASEDMRGSGPSVTPSAEISYAYHLFSNEDVISIPGFISRV